MKHKPKYLLIILLAVGAFLRFYNLNWGSPFYFHPDERNIVDLVLKSSLTNPASLLKGTFAYGNFPVILTLLLKPLFLPFFQLFKIFDPFSQAIIILRFISAVFSVLTLYVIYLCGKFWSEKTGLIALFLSVFSAGFIQQAHFGTYDGLAAFCSVTIFYFLVWFIKTKKILFFYASILILAIGTASKINLLILALFPFVVLITNSILAHRHSGEHMRLQNHKARALPVGRQGFWTNQNYVIRHAVPGILLLISLIFFLSPNYLTKDFFGALLYERGLVTGTIPVFYTQSFYATTPIVFQFLHILPFLINPLLTLIFAPALFYVIYKGIKTINPYFLLLTSYFLLLFLPQSFLFAKWTRYMVPTLPFIYLIIAITIADVIARSEGDLPADRQAKQSLKTNRLPRSFQSLAMTVLIFTSILFGISYFITAFVKPDTRIAASTFARNNIPPNAKILSEPYDLGFMAFNGVSQNTNIFNFYELDANIPESNHEKLNNALASTDYIVLPSQRLLRSRVLNSKKFPQGHGFYSLLINEAAGYEKIYETPCDIFCKITYLGNPIFSFEETATVFERPTVFIYKKIK